MSIWWHARCIHAGRWALAGFSVLAAVFLAGAGAASAARRAAPAELQITPGVGVLSTSWGVTTSTGLAGFRVRSRPLTVPASPWGRAVELAASARSYDIVGLSVGIYEVRVRALIATRRKHGVRRTKVGRLGGLASGAATTFSGSEQGSTPASQPPHEAVSPKEAVRPTEAEPPKAEPPTAEPPKVEPPREEPPKEEPPKEEPPKEEPPKEEPPKEEPPKEEPPKEEPPKEEPPKEEPPKEEPPKEEPPKEEPPKEEGPGSSCALYASPTGLDGNTGAQSSPLRTVHALLGKLAAGQTGCLARGKYPAVTVRDGESHGGAGAPVTITSTNAETPATIAGRIITMPGADWLTFSHLILTDPGVRYPSVTIGSAHTSWIWNDVSAPETICFEPVDPGPYGPAEHTLIEHNRIHNCGQPFLCDIDIPPCNEPPNDGYHIHGVYDMGNFTTVRNNYIYENSSKGVLLRGGKGAVVEHNVIDGNGSGVLFGDLTPEGETVAWNIITNSRGVCETCRDYFGIWSFGSVGPANTAANNDVFGNASGNIGPLDAVNLEENIEVDPLYVDAAKHDYRLQPDSPVLGYGPQ
ncbi:MAG TPA: right-handed parallel beta-helix repeat-containing protein [Solirubrobacteraceae bacterium]|nr:right-handed parallel beta-helix repeat-containing protein [Solirubrobacteraceae bacterium]